MLACGNSIHLGGIIAALRVGWVDPTITAAAFFSPLRLSKPGRSDYSTAKPNTRSEASGFAIFPFARRGKKEYGWGRCSRGLLGFALFVPTIKSWGVSHQRRDIEFRGLIRSTQPTIKPGFSMEGVHPGSRLSKK